MVVDRLTKYAYFIPISHPYNAAKVASLYMHYVFKLHGLPATLVSDRDATFTSLFWSKLFRLQGKHWPCLQLITLSLMAKLRLFIKV